MPGYREVVAATDRLVQAVRRAVPGYAGRCAPMDADRMATLVAAAGCQVVAFPFRSDAMAMILPPCGGVRPVLVDSPADGPGGCFAVRHELAHVLSRHAGSAVCFRGEGYQTHQERVADLFALADVVPGWWIADLSGRRAPLSRVLREITDAVVTRVHGWPAERLHDRAVLRLRLFCDAAI